ncbi:hypothetical protein JDV02_000939 [Purpureocillium takamizusanense]|uniref:Peptidase A4 family protein n=1 Tax=Purpureocillium takamizusanense TaxID=2060973 RepID=A0A9Q8Q8A4_9HYPO|nr:uncharacterized protein JDV02_000939 [Purpureocillium takamizusanense]UNI14296.1 hypothetical protein JDV02_000939 [Purpureocillium takamizusanense]
MRQKKPSVLVLLGALATAAFVPVSGAPSHDDTSAPRLRPRQTVQNAWGGAVQQGQGWHYVTGTVTIPRVGGQSPSAAASAWVGIDGWSCQNAILQTGVNLYGDGSLATWYEWWPDASAYYDTPIDLRAGDRLRLSVFASSSTSGNVTIENLSNGQAQSHVFQGEGRALCASDAEWVVEDFGSDYNGNHVPFVDFGSVEFLDAVASGPNGNVTPQGASIVNVEIDGAYRTDCGSNANGVRCNYV